jgi:hypothetical protein
MSIAWVNTNAGITTGTNSLLVPLPGSRVVGNLLLAGVVNKYPPDVPTTPTGYTLPTNGQGSGGAGSAGVDSGEVVTSIYTRIIDGTETNPTISITNGNSAGCRMFQYSRSAGIDWDIACAYGVQSTGGSTAISITASQNLDLAAGDILLVITGLNSDRALASQVVSATGITFDTMVERSDNSIGNGDDCQLIVTEHPITAGNDTVAPVFTATANGSGTNNPAGVAIFVRLREASAVAGDMLMLQGMGG